MAVKKIIVKRNRENISHIGGFMFVPALNIVEGEELIKRIMAEEGWKQQIEAGVMEIVEEAEDESISISDVVKKMKPVEGVKFVKELATVKDLEAVLEQSQSATVVKAVKERIAQISDSDSVSKADEKEDKESETFFQD